MLSLVRSSSVLLRSSVACAVRTASSMEAIPASAAAESASAVSMVAFCATTSAPACTDSSRATILPFADVVAFLHQYLGDGRRAQGVRAQIDVILGFNLAGGGDGGGQILAERLAGLHFDDAPFVKSNAGEYAAADQHDQGEGQQYLPFTLHLGQFLSPGLDVEVERFVR